MSAFLHRLFLFLYRPRFVVFSLLSVMLYAAPASAAAEPESNWLNVVRKTPYWASQGVAENLATIRSWVLLGEGYCGESRRHLLFDHRARFLAYIDDADSREATIDRLNDTRQRLVQQERAAYWSRGSANSRGYPLALACHQPDADMAVAIARLTGATDEYRIWGTWDGIRVGEPDSQVSLVELFRIVYEHRKAQGRFTFPDGVMPTFLGKTIIESGGQKDALSPQAARGIMQLRPEVLDDCEIPERYRLHRIAQVDCALRLVEQNHRNLREPFMAVFGAMATEKREQLYGFLLTQSYQIGVGRTIELLEDDELGRAARYFAANDQNFSAGDIQVGLIFHNMGRRDIGLRTLYYVTDARIAREALCASAAMKDDPWCAAP
ncbi:hypothetical protein [Alkalilimnicola ehrlichii]|nr:hypothetical protein [Alkalilimnicola ehrlichii]